MTSTQLAPAIIIPLIAWRIYVRTRRSIGPQPFQPKRLLVRIGIFSGLCLAIGFAALVYPPSLAALGGGLLLGVPLALLGLRLTKIEQTAQRIFYTPNTAIGVALSVLFAGRITYRLLVLYANPPTDGNPHATLFHSPLTLLIFGVTAGYYIAYYTGVLRRGRKLA